MKKSKKDKRTADSAEKAGATRPIKKEKLDLYHKILEKPHAEHAELKPYREWTDEELIREAKSKAVDRISLLMTDWKLYMELNGRILLDVAYPED